MPLEPWYRVVTARPEVREGRSFSPDGFAIALEQVKAGTAPPDYTDPAQFFARTCFTGRWPVTAAWRCAASPGRRRTRPRRCRWGPSSGAARPTP